MSSDAKLKAIYARISPELHRLIRLTAAEEDRSMQQVVVSALRAYVEMPRGAAPKR